MPYKNLEEKRAWELAHRGDRLARRRELRQISAARLEARPAVSRAAAVGPTIAFSIVAGGALAAYNPTFAIGAVGLTLIVGGYYNKDRRWWIAGIIVLVIGLLCQWNQGDSKQIPLSA